MQMTRRKTNKAGGRETIIAMALEMLHYANE